jgi:type IV fimbrial biogenesis protein FimT
MNMRARGFTLIELMIAISIFAFLIMLAGPMYADFMGNTQIRNAAESTLSGLRVAQAEAVKRNAQVAFVLTPATGWQVVGTDADGVATTIQTYSFSDGAAKATITADATRVTFDGLGRIVQPNPDGTVPIQLVQVTNTNVSATSRRDLNVVVGLDSKGFGVKMCDPKFAATDPVGCP